MKLLTSPYRMDDRSLGRDSSEISDTSSCVARPVRAAFAGLVLTLLLLALGCPKTDQSLVLVAGETVDAAVIDAKPLVALPRGALMIGQLDAQAMFRTNLGGQVGQLVGNLLPLGQESNFIPARDVQRIFVGIYAMQGADFCAVLQGNFDEAAIRSAGDARANTPSGVPLVKQRYAGNDIYTVANIGFVPLTRHTILSGNETGLRRALDRLRYGLDDSLPGWMSEILEDRRAQFSWVGDVSNQGAVEATGDRVPFLQGLRIIRVLGNFLSPGMNAVGTLSYGDVQSAAAGAQSLSQLQQLSFLISFLSSLGFGRTPEIEVLQVGNDVQFSVEMDTSMLSVLLSVAIQATNPGSAQPTFWGF